MTRLRGAAWRAAALLALALGLIAASATGLLAPAARAQGATIPICHATGDPANPYEALEIPDDGLSPHVDHEDDLIPAPAGGCASGETGDAEDLVLICHATGDPADPYVLLELTLPGLADHRTHGQDLIPAPDDACPAPATGAVPPAPEATASPTPVTTVAPRPRTRRPDRRRTGQNAPAGALPSAVRGSAAPAVTAKITAAQPVGATTPAAAPARLPRTGPEVGLLAMAGYGLLMAGYGLRLLSRPWA